MDPYRHELPESQYPARTGHITIYRCDRDDAWFADVSQSAYGIPDGLTHYAQMPTGFVARAHWQVVRREMASRFPGDDIVVDLLSRVDRF